MGPEGSNGKTGNASPSPSGGLNLLAVTIETSMGRVDVMYDLQVEGDTLHLKDLIVYPRTAEPLLGFFVSFWAPARRLPRMQGKRDSLS